MAETIMVVEDDEELNEIIHYNLTRAGYEVIQAWDGLQAIEAIRQSAPGLIILDVMLPGVDGWEVCHSLQDSPELREIPIVFLTAKSAREDFDQARQFNIAGFFTKPFTTVDVLRHVEKVLSAKNSAQSMGKGGQADV
ncbi:MAG: response regulator [Armatimonadetes bacterium]|nr:response regulator [Armatimonadota bacterium]